MKKIILTDRFLIELEEILEFIAIDSLDRAINFHKQLTSKIKTTSNMPYMNRQSLKSTNPNIREPIFKSYVIPYRIHDNSIEILGIFNQNFWTL